MEGWMGRGCVWSRMFPDRRHTNISVPLSCQACSAPQYQEQPRLLLPIDYGEGGVPPLSAATSRLPPTGKRRPATSKPAQRLPMGGLPIGGLPMPASAPSDGQRTREKAVAPAQHIRASKAQPRAASAKGEAPRRKAAPWDSKFLPVAEPGIRNLQPSEVLQELAPLQLEQASLDRSSVAKQGNAKQHAGAPIQVSRHQSEKPEQHMVIPVGRGVVQSQLHTLLDQLNSPRSKMGLRLESRPSSGSSHKSPAPQPGVKVVQRRLTSTAITRSFLHTVLHDPPSKAILPAGTSSVVPEWKADIVERVRRRRAGHIELTAEAETVVQAADNQAGANGFGGASHPLRWSCSGATPSRSSVGTARAHRGRLPRELGEIATLNRKGSMEEGDGGSSVSGMSSQSGLSAQASGHVRGKSRGGVMTMHDNCGVADPHATSRCRPLPLVAR